MLACTSPKKLTEKGQEYEAAGRYAEAADYYIRALQSDPSVPGAHEGLQRSGEKAIERYLAKLDEHERGSRFEYAASEMVKIDRLRRSAEAVGVGLSVPADYEGTRRRIFDGAIVALIEKGRLEERRGAWSQAFAYYDKAQQQYGPSSEQIEQLDAARYHTLVQWGDAEISDGNYRSAYARAENAMQIYGEDSPKSHDARALRGRAVELGTVDVAVLPVWRKRKAARSIPDGFVSDLNDRLEDEAWSSPPMFVAVSDTRRVRTEVRRLEFDREIISEGRAATVGEMVDANYVAQGFISAFDVFPPPEGENARPVAGGRGGRGCGCGEGVVYDGMLHVHATVVVRIIDVKTRAIVSEAEVAVEGEAPLGRRKAIRDMYRQVAKDLGELYEAAVYEETQRVLR
jgi:tetratricopeptide (TPR) repeat protein